MPRRRDSTLRRKSRLYRNSTLHLHPNRMPSRNGGAKHQSDMPSHRSSRHHNKLRHHHKTGARCHGMVDRRRNSMLRRHNTKLRRNTIRAASPLCLHMVRQQSPTARGARCIQPGTAPNTMRVTKAS
jgi:hypothetical protein